MSQCMVPKWNLRHQRQEQQVEEEGNRSSHVLNQQNNPSLVFVPMSNYEVAELTWENGKLAMHGHGGINIPTVPTKPTWGATGDTLESLINQATYHNHNLNSTRHDQNPTNISSIVASSGGKRGKSSSHLQMDRGMVKKGRVGSESDRCGRNFSSSVAQEERGDRSACASASANFVREKDATLMTWASFESPPPSLKTKTTDEDSACDLDGSENRDEEHETKGDTVRSHSTRRSRAAAVHNQSERRRRDRINQKIKALQKLVPNACKTDKASMLDEVIEYLKQLQAQVQMMNTVRNMPQMMMPLGMQQQLQMSLLARMGMGVGFGVGMDMLDMTNVARPVAQSLPPALIHPNHPVAAASTAFVPPPFVVPPMIPARSPAQATAGATTSSPVPFSDPYCAFLAQSMNIDLYNKMVALYRQVNQTTQPTSSPSQSNHYQGER
ncbi:unnamed protein product [Ilex paraguariensis]|uniref:BHLH domain-containing protein n=1 Tax=Ilex paraguariensis TaxID=185542 RepID=A0ABC8RTF9_9AQUA